MAIQVFIIDDSAVVRQTLMHLIQGDPEIVLAGSAPNPLIAAPMIRKCQPDVLLLDIEMPGMDGLTFLRQQMAEKPIPTVICSTLSAHGSQVALEALSAGAVAIVPKPRLGLKQFLEDSRAELLSTLRTAAKSRPRVSAMPAGVAHHGPAGASHRPHAGGAGGAGAAGTKPGLVATAARSAGLHAFAVNKPVIIGSSTGGTQAIESILLTLPADSPGIAIVQHMPEKFTAMYAQRLDTLCQVRVKEAQDGDRLERGLVLIAPGGRHMQLQQMMGQYRVKVFDGPPVNRHKPSVDVLMKSAAECAGADALGIMLTGMGDDGARGMKLMHDKGARCLAQDEASCVVFGMPKEAIKMGGVDEILPLDRMASAILSFDARDSLRR